MDELRRAAQELAESDPSFEVVGPAVGGGHGVFLLRDRAGVVWIAKLLHNPHDMSVAQVRLSAVLRERGYPLSEHVMPKRLSMGDFQLQRWIQGDTRENLSMEMAREMVRLNGLLADAPGDPALFGFGDLIKRSLATGVGDYCSHEPLRRHSDTTRSLLAWIHEVGRRSADVDVPEVDAVHYDFHHLNVLWKGDVAAAVIDWDGSRIGDRFFDLITLAVDANSLTSEDVLRYLRSEIRLHVPAERIRLYVAHMVLRVAVWNIEHRPDRVRDGRLRDAFAWVEWADSL
jgi:thiamine kinase-like enzyme